MPELPEVETVVRALRDSIVGAVITSVDVSWPGSIAHPAPEEFTRLIAGRQICAVERRGKWILLTLDGGRSLLVHLRMTGRLLLADGDCKDRLHTRLSLLLSDGRRVCFHDVRKFGRCWLTDDVDEALGDLGPEPLDDLFTSHEFATMLSQRRGRIKPLLLNQRFLAGLGNIYVDEALWRSGIHPLRRADRLSGDEAHSLWRAIRTVLRRATEAGGTTLHDGAFVDIEGAGGRFAPRLAAYARAGQPCIRCGAVIERIVVGGRGTHICPVCQAAPVGAPPLAD
jgi:formamidopyrimidine-DNA glycosylase